MRPRSTLFVIVCTIVIILVTVYVNVNYICSNRLVDNDDEKNCANCDKIFNADELTKLENGYENQDDPMLVKLIRQRWLVGPSESPLKLRDDSVADPSQVGQALFVDRLLNYKTHGFYVECGAANGETYSNSLYFERFRAWGGLLIEPNPLYFKEILQMNRRGFSINSCLSTSVKTERVVFQPSGLFGGIDGKMDSTHMKVIKEHSSPSIIAQCFPFWSILQAIPRKHVDYFSLDVEGPELDILATIPWDAVYIDVISVEYRSSDGKSIDRAKTAEKLAKVRAFFNKIGLYKEVGIRPWGSHDNNERQEDRGLDVFYKHI